MKAVEQLEKAIKMSLIFVITLLFCFYYIISSTVVNCNYPDTFGKNKPLQYKQKRLNPCRNRA